LICSNKKNPLSNEKRVIFNLLSRTISGDLSNTQKWTSLFIGFGSNPKSLGTPQDKLSEILYNVKRVDIDQYVETLRSISKLTSNPHQLQKEIRNLIPLSTWRID